MIQQCVDIFFFEFINFMHMGNSVTDFINLFSLLNLKKNDDMILSYFKKSEALNIYQNLNDQQQFRLNKINEVKRFFYCRD